MGHCCSRIHNHISADLYRGRALKPLSEKEAKAIKMRFGLDGMAEHTMQQVADAIGVSRQRAHQIEKAALKKLSRSEILRSFWEVGHGGD